MSQTQRLAERIATANYEDIPPAAREVAKQALMDFVGVTVAGMEEPLAQILCEEVDEEGGHPQATLIGTGKKVTVQQAALVNGAAGHAHDYDDVQMDMTGHPTVPVAPVVLALAEHNALSGREVINAFAAGVDAECIVGRYAGSGPYKKGWHNTGTLGSFGAAAAAANLLKLDAEQTASALGLAGTQAAGLKSQFGTMCKPLHAGHAAATGAQAAKLAQKGFTSRPDILEVEQGFMDTQAETANPEKFDSAMQQPSYCQDILFKYHAACYLTHSAIEATLRLTESNAFDPKQIGHIKVVVDEGHLRTCNIQEPTTGLEAKFSLRFTVAMALTGTDTASIDAFADELTTDANLNHYRDLVTVEANPKPTPDTTVTITLTDGTELSETINVGIPSRDLEAQWSKLTTKFRALVSGRIGTENTERLIKLCRELEAQDDLSPLYAAISAQ